MEKTMNYKHLYSEFLSRSKNISLTSHSHHFWPDCTLKAVRDYWFDSATYSDQKWDIILGVKYKEYKHFLADELNLQTSQFNLTLASNTHELLTRIISSTFAQNKKSKILSTTGEFHSFRRQALLWKKHSVIDLDLISTDKLFNPDELENRLSNNYDVLFFSHVFFNSGEVFPYFDLLKKYKQKNPHSLIIIDGYHSFMAIPIDWSLYVNDFIFLAGSYKYAQAGEGLCFAVTPQSQKIETQLSGWFANFAHLSSENEEELTSFDDHFFLFGATQDFSTLYKSCEVFKMFKENHLSTEKILNHSRALEILFLNHIHLNSELKEILLRSNKENRGRFLCLKDKRAQRFSDALLTFGINTDVRGETLRLSFALYHTSEDIPKIVELFNQAWKALS
jgi:selenocysteine lyase/cysteine desulfurase